MAVDNVIKALQAMGLGANSDNYLHLFNLTKIFVENEEEISLTEAATNTKKPTLEPVKSTSPEVNASLTIQSKQKQREHEGRLKEKIPSSEQQQTAHENNEDADAKAKKKREQHVQRLTDLGLEKVKKIGEDLALSKENELKEYKKELKAYKRELARLDENNIPAAIATLEERLVIKGELEKLSEEEKKQVIRFVKNCLAQITTEQELKELDDEVRAISRLENEGERQERIVHLIPHDTIGSNLLNNHSNEGPEVANREQSVVDPTRITSTNTVDTEYRESRNWRFSKFFGAPKKNSTAAAVTPNNKLVTVGIGTLLSVAFVAVVAIVLIGLLANPVGIGIIPAIALAGFFGVFAGVLVAGIAHNQKSLFWEKTRKLTSLVSPREWLKKGCTKLFGEKWGPRISETLYMAIKVTLAVVAVVAFVQLCIALGGTPLLLFAPKAALFALGCTGFVGALTTTSCCGDLGKGCKEIGLVDSLAKGWEKLKEPRTTMGGKRVKFDNLVQVPGTFQHSTPVSLDVFNLNNFENQEAKVLGTINQSNLAPKPGEHAVEGGNNKVFDSEMLQEFMKPKDKITGDTEITVNVKKPEEKQEFTRALGVKVS